MRFKTAIGGFIWIDILTVTSVLFEPDGGAFNNRIRKHIITFSNHASIETLLAKDEDMRLLKCLDMITSAKLADMGIAAIGPLALNPTGE